MRHRLQQSELMALCFTALPIASAWFLALPRPRIVSTRRIHQNIQQTTLLRNSKVIDAEFEPVKDHQRTQEHDDPNPEKKKKQSQTYLQPPSTGPGFESALETSLLDLSLQSDPEISNLRVPFMEGAEKCIDTKLGFLTELDGVTYALGVPFDVPAAITLENTQTGSVQNLSPDDDENQELMELMAAQLQEHVGPDLRLIRSPRVLTISGPLDNYTAHWQDEVLPKSFDTETLLQTDNEDVESFLQFMKEELGEEEVAKTMNEEHFLDDDVLNLFSGLGGDGDDNDDDIAAFLQKEMEDIVNSQGPDDYSEQQQAVMENVVGKADMLHDGVALKLVSYSMKNGKQYSLVQLLKPIVLVAKQVYRTNTGKTNSKTTPHFELLTPEEHRLVAPRLEEDCRVDLKRLGFDFDD